MKITASITALALALAVSACETTSDNHDSHEGHNHGDHYDHSSHDTYENSYGTYESSPPAYDDNYILHNSTDSHALLDGVDYNTGVVKYAAEMVTNEGFDMDASAFTQHLFEEAAGIQLPRTVQLQSQVGEIIDRNDLQEGDLVFFNTQQRPYSHVGVYVGEGRFVYSNGNGAVRVRHLMNNYFKDRYDGARRVLGVLEQQ